MHYEYYFSKNIDENTWEDFAIQEHSGKLHLLYQKISGYGWKDKFSYNYNGKALYISEHANIHKGVWFDIGNRRIAVFSK